MPKVTSLEEIPENRKRRHVVFADAPTVELSLEVACAAGLLPGRTVSRAAVRKAQKEDALRRAEEDALALLRRKDRSEAELRRALASAGHGAEVVEAILKKCRGWGYLDDRCLAERLVSDGIETCDGDPVAAAKAFIAEGLNLRIHVVGFDISRNVPARDQLIAIARSTGGMYFDANSREELRRALSIAAPFSYTVYDQEGNLVFEGRIGQDGPSLPAGSYTVVIDTSPPITLSSVVVQDQATTLITVEQADGGFRAEVEN